MLPSSDDDFGLSSSDEADLLALESSQTSMKRKADDLTNGSSGSNKKARNANATSAAIATANDVLQQRFGMIAFRLEQQAAIARLLEGGSSVVVFPTGGGKSLCYQLPALCFKEMDRLAGMRQGDAEGGITLVISPLIALMKDQVDALRRRGISAAVLDSTKTKEEYFATVDSMRNGTLDILYCAPERLNNEAFVGSMANVRGGVRLIAVDEAHCISEWGHSFRADYLKVARFAKEIQAERVVCLTATATPKVAEDVRQAFGIPPEGLFRTSSYRPNLRLYAQSYQTKKDTYPKLHALLRANPGPSIVYVSLQKHTEELAGHLRKQGFNARHFHAGMDKDLKTQCQDAFMASNNLIIVATIAFGMGIDKANIRNVVHFDIPRSLEGYSQEIGRAGRDGLKSTCMLYLCAEDMHLRESFARGDLPSKESVARLLDEVFTSRLIPGAAGMTIEANVNHQAKEYDIKPNVLNNIYAQLELRFDLLRATTPKYTSYSYTLLTRVDHDKSAAATALRNAAKKATKLWHIDVEVAERRSGLSRSELVGKLNSWNDEKRIDLRTAGVVNIYRVLKTLPTSPNEKKIIVDALYSDLEDREKQELKRMASVVNLVTGRNCFARTLCEHFGDALPNNAKKCGHCTWCETQTPVERVKPVRGEWNSQAFKQVLEACPSRDDPRYLARIAFGIHSPRVGHAKLGKSPAFGSMDDQDFDSLLKAFTKVCDGAG